MMFAGRAQHIDQVIEPQLAQGNWVLCDRFTDATYAYQGAGREMGDDLIQSLETMVQGDMRPDLTLVLDVPVELGLERAGKRSEPDRFELEKTDFFNRVRQAYLSMATNNPQRYKIIDASQTLEHVQLQIADTLNSFLQKDHNG
jgi:dTMP kinase